MASSSSSSSSPLSYFRIYTSDDPVSISGENLSRENNFEITINVFRQSFEFDPQVAPIIIFQHSSIIPCEDLHQYIPRFFQQGLSIYLSYDDFQLIASDITSYAQSQTSLQTTHRYNLRRRRRPRLLPLNLIVDIVIAPTTDQEDEDVDMVTNRVIEQSMQQVPMVPASEEAITSLKQVEVINQTEYCSICLENFEEDDDVSGMPCEHVYHKDCIVEWLKTSHMCPLCRFKMPVQ